MMQTIAGLRTRTERVRGLNLTVVEGPRNGPPLILLAGLLDLWTDYEAVLPQLVQRFHVILLEHRGHGTSQWASDGRYRVRDYADDLIALLETMRLGPVFISGNSLGGLIALDIASRRPELVRAIALEDAPLLITYAPHWQKHWQYPMFATLVDELKQWRELGEAKDALARRVATVPMYRPRLEQDAAARKYARDTMIRALCGSGALDSAEQARVERGWQRYVQGERPTLGECLPPFVIESIAEVMATVDHVAPMHALDERFNEGFDHLGSLAAVRCPVLFWEADRVLGGLLSPEQIDMVEAALQHVPHRHVIAEGGGHHIHCDVPDQFVEVSTEFFMSIA